MTTVKWIVFVIAIKLLSASPDSNDGKKKIAIIGAGAAGLVSARVALSKDHEVKVFETRENLGGVWLYTPNPPIPTYEIYSPVYEGLRTNTPYQTMDFSDFPYPEGTASYPSYIDVWNYLNSYAEKFELRKKIYFNHHVHSVRPINDGKWEIEFEDKLTKNNPIKKSETETEIFDVVFVCTGTYSSPKFPNIPGEEHFKGIKLHSKNFRSPKKFADKKVLVIGNGPSGLDIAELLSNNNVSVRRTQKAKPWGKVKAQGKKGCIGDRAIKNITDVKYFTKNGVVFTDEEKEAEFDVVIYATGYKFWFPFLDSNVCKYTEYTISPLYKGILNINYPTMAFIGLLTNAVHNRMYELQARFALTFIMGEKQMPTRDEMLEDSRRTPIRDGYKPEKPYKLGFGHKQYYDEIANTADIPNIPDVIANVYTDALKSQYTPGFRNYKYIINMENQTWKKDNEKQNIFQIKRYLDYFHKLFIA